MEYMDGGTLGDLLKARPRIPEPHPAQMARQVSIVARRWPQCQNNSTCTSLASVRLPRSAAQATVCLWLLRFLGIRRPLLAMMASMASTDQANPKPDSTSALPSNLT